MRILVTRPEPDGERTAKILRARGHAVLLAPMLRVETIDADIGAGSWAAVLMTSANAARAVATNRAIVRLPAFTVGDRSADAAREAGFIDVSSANGDAGDLARLVAARLADRRAPLLYLAGEDQAADLAGALANHGFEVTTAIVYRAVAAQDLPADVAAAIAAGDIDAVLHYSARSAAAFLAAARAAEVLNKSLTCQHYCLSANVAAPLLAAGAGQLSVAPAPDEGVLLDLVGNA